jgi:hypothetical protein
MAEKKKTVAVDLDATLITYDKWVGQEHFGSPRPGAAEFMTALREKYRVVIHTTRTSCGPEVGRECGDTEELRHLVASWLDAHGIVYDEVWCRPGKPIAVAYVDDRAVSVPKNPVAIDWPVIRGMIDQLATRE